MSDAELWRELGQQLRVDSIRAAAVPKSGHPTSSMSAADLMAVLLAKYLRYDFDQPGRPAERPLDLLQGPRLAAALLHLQGRRRGHRRGAADLPQARLAARGPPDAEDPVGRRRDGLARPGAADRASASRSPGKKLDRLPYRVWVPLRRQRARRGLDVGGVRARGVRGARQPDRDPRHQPARPARRDDARLGSLVVHAAGRGVRLGGDRDRRARRRRDRPRVRGGAVDDRPADGDRRAHDQGQRRARPSRTRRTGTARRSTIRKPAIAELGGERNIVVDVHKPDGRRTAARRSRPARSSCRPTTSAARWRRARPTATRCSRSAAARRRRRARRRGLELDPRRGVREGASRTATSRCTSPSSSSSRRRSACRCASWKPFASTFAAFFTRAYDFIRMAAISQANIRLVRLARRRLDRRGRPVADGARGPRRRSARCTAARCCTRATRTRRRSSSRRWPISTASRSCARRAAPRR